MNSILFLCYGELKNDGRILRSIQTAIDSGMNVQVVSYSQSADLGLNGSYRHQHITKPKKMVGQLLALYHAVKYVARFRPDIIHLHDYYYAPAIGLLKTVFKKTALVYDAHELIIYPDEKYPNKRAAFFARSEKRNIRYADAVVAANHERADVMKQHYGLKDIAVVRNIPEFNFDLREKKKRQNATDKITLVYQGAVYKGRGIERFIDIVGFADPRIQLLVIGDGPQLPELKALAEQKGLAGRVQFLGKVAPAELYKIMAERCDFGIITYTNKNLNNALCAPNKLYEYAHMGLPFITSNQETILSEVAGYHFYLPIDVEKDPSGIAQNISDYVLNYTFDSQEFEDFKTRNNWETEKQTYDRLWRSLA